MATKTYDQYCGIAAALDRVGDRWTLLVLRELSFGECRFTDLRSRLPGIATNLLADRLRSLEEDGLVEQRELPAPAARSVYALTPEGRRVTPVLRALSGFGQAFLPDPVEGAVRPEMVVHGTLAPRLDSRAWPDTSLRVRFALGGSEQWLELEAGRLVRPDTGAPPDLLVAGSAAALMELCRGTARLADLGDRLQVSGSRAARRTFAKVFALVL
ncbi:winged helix-turn-helix transcriptional regulator [Nocardioides cynanchi]|uniref:winged helix-turn-helix transcriptional regulator n=1 Tax=Nocardioides cynanchi TaxID=2558918 RepID=UPI0017828A66|nr:helix-turn-helix domain-containing protein [Nocardioides cynanchi]